ncbi:hypothetical protein BA939_19510 [Rhizobium sp. S41]|nr:hypothetical protein BA939_19510 [Rhizobium sp. S41]KGE80723.1 hypothetical protein LW14_21215 [Rhizobium sp. H41]
MLRYYLRKGISSRDIEHQLLYLTTLRNATRNIMTIDTETRRTIAQRVINRAAARGAPINADPAFLALLEEWIRGDIDMRTMREQYLDVFAIRTAERRVSRESLSGKNPSEPSDEVTQE